MKEPKVSKTPIQLISNEIIWTLDKMNRMYAAGEIVGFQAQVQLNNATFVTLRAGNLTYIEKLGLLEAAKAYVVNTAKEL
jgi:hypothetical protein